MTRAACTQKEVEEMSWINNVRRVTPYTPGEQPKEKNIIKLNTNENPYPPSAAVMEALRGVSEDGLRRYPDPTVSLLVDEIAAYHGFDSDQVFVGVGSDDVIAMAFMTFFNSKSPILFPDITYSFYDVWAELFGISYETRPLREDFTIDPEDYKGKNGGIIFPNPNAPTGIVLSMEAIEDIVASNPDSVVIVDEAYVDFHDETALTLVNKYGNLLVTRTFSKSRSLAGIRIGYAIGNPELIKYLNDVKFSYNSYTMNQPSIAVGVASIRDEEAFRSSIDRIVSTRKRTARALEDMGWRVLPSGANFVLASPGAEVDTSIVFEKLRDRGIYVRYFKKPRIDKFLRITIGTDDEMEALLKALQEII